jgi:hypothetical protein
MKFLSNLFGRVGTFFVDAAILLALLAVIYIWMKLPSKPALVAPESTRPAFEVDKVIPKMGQ